MSRNLLLIWINILTKLFSWRFNFQELSSVRINLLSASSTKWSNTLKKFVSNLPTNFLIVLDHFFGLALKNLTLADFEVFWQIHKQSFLCVSSLFVKLFKFLPQVFIWCSFTPNKKYFCFLAVDLFGFKVKFNNQNVQVLAISYLCNKKGNIAWYFETFTKYQY